MSQVVNIKILREGKHNMNKISSDIFMNLLGTEPKGGWERIHNSTLCPLQCCQI